VPTSRVNKQPSQDATASILDSIRRLSRGLRLAAQETQSAAGISAAQLFVLRTLDDGEAASVSDLAERTLTDRSSVASVVDRLLQAKLVSRVASESDKRRASITITAKGRAVVRKAPAAPTTLILSALNDMPARELKPLAEGLAKLINAIGFEKGPVYMLFEEKSSSKRRSSR
jgi:DNA-binding MarR family transcriptional regulator